MKNAVQHRAAARPSPVSVQSRPLRRDQRRIPALRGSALGLILMLLLGSFLSDGCATSQHRRPRRLALAGAAVALAGSGVWVAGEQRSDPGTMPTVGLGIVAVGVAAMIAAGGWIAAQVSCQSDPDCEETEECREIPAPPGGIPYKQCMLR